MCKKLPVDGFTWEEDLSIFTSDFIKNYDENSDKGYLFRVDVTYPQESVNYMLIYPFYVIKCRLMK